MTVQAILFPIKKFTTAQARKYLNKQKYYPIKRVDKTKNYLRYRLKPPYKKDKYISKKLKSGIIYVIKI